MRFYSLVNMYLSDIQRGIQTAHAVHDMIVKYPAFDGSMAKTEGSLLLDWMENHKTIIVLNGGNSAMLSAAYDRIAELSAVLGLPYVHFREDEQSLNGALTCVGVVVPENIYSLDLETAAIDPSVLPEEIQLKSLLSEFRLA